MSHERIGDVLVAQGDGAGALAAYRKSLAIAEALAGRDPATTGWQRDFVGEPRRSATSWWPRATARARSAAYRKRAWRFGEALAGRDPGQHRVAARPVGEPRAGSATSQGPGRRRRLAAYRKSLAIAETLARRDPANTEWQRDLSVSHNKIGDVLVAQGDGAVRLSPRYRKSPGDRRRRWPGAIRPTPGGSATCR